MNVTYGESLARHVTFRAGGAAEKFVTATDRESLATALQAAHASGESSTLLGWGSNLLPSDAGVAGWVIRNKAQRLDFGPDGEVWAETGISYQEIFLKTVQRGLAGLEFAVGIPGTLGGALVSNAGAYRSEISEFVQELDIVLDGERCLVPKEWMEFSYRDSVLRNGKVSRCGVVAVKLKLPTGDRHASYREARVYQVQRISKQPPSPSAGSVFKNVLDPELARKLPRLPAVLQEKGIIPAGYLIESCGLKGYRIGGARVGLSHANFIVNDRGATATDIRSLAAHVKRTVHSAFGVELEEEILYVGDWSAFEGTLSQP